MKKSPHHKKKIEGEKERERERTSDHAFSHYQYSFVPCRFLIFPQQYNALVVAILCER